MIARRLLADRGGSSAAEFALVLPLLVVFLLGTVDVARFLWECNRAEKATQMGARYAVVTDIIPSGLAGYSFADPANGGLAQGSVVPSANFAGAECKSTTVSGNNATAISCSCLGGSCPWLGTANLAAFNKVAARMRLVFPRLTAANVEIRYEYSGLGYAGDPNGADVAPLVVVRLRNVGFKPVLMSFFQTASINLPDFRAALTLEDGSGDVAN